MVLRYLITNFLVRKLAKSSLSNGNRHRTCLVRLYGVPFNSQAIAISWNCRIDWKGTSEGSVAFYTCYCRLSICLGVYVSLVSVADAANAVGIAMLSFNRRGFAQRSSLIGQRLPLLCRGNCNFSDSRVNPSPSSSKNVHLRHEKEIVNVRSKSLCRRASSHSVISS